MKLRYKEAKGKKMKTNWTERYEMQSKLIKKNILKLKKQLKTHQQKQKEQPCDWGYVGDLIYINEKIEEITSFTSG